MLVRLTKSKSKFIKVDVKVEEVDAIDKLELVETLRREIKIHIRKWIQGVKHSLSLNIFKQNLWQSWGYSCLLSVKMRADITFSRLP